LLDRFFSIIVEINLRENTRKKMPIRINRAPTMM
jgi:hypothetical protein